MILSMILNLILKPAFMAAFVDICIFFTSAMAKQKLKQVLEDKKVLYLLSIIVTDFCFLL